jgi:hypothetical protein
MRAAALEGPEVLAADGRNPENPEVDASDISNGPVTYKANSVQTLWQQAFRAAAPLGVLAFWCGLWIAGELYPSEYDWRYMTISSLLYPDRNPDGYRWAWGGVALCGLGGLCWHAIFAARIHLFGVGAASTTWRRTPRGSA